MGVVCLAVQFELNREVALKMIHGQTGPSAVTRFVAEAEALAELRHPNLVEVFAAGEYRGCSSSPWNTYRTGRWRIDWPTLCRPRLANTMYWFRVVAFNEVGEAVSADFSVRTKR